MSVNLGPGMEGGFSAQMD